VIIVVRPDRAIEALGDAVNEATKPSRSLADK
jgi:hypothetical protein